eukprot:3379907-Pleurochrysis_carterae.AAC.2
MRCTAFSVGAEAAVALAGYASTAAVFEMDCTRVPLSTATYPCFREDLKTAAESTRTRNCAWEH